MEPDRAAHEGATKLITLDQCLTGRVCLGSTCGQYSGVLPKWDIDRNDRCYLGMLFFVTVGSVSIIVG